MRLVYFFWIWNNIKTQGMICSATRWRRSGYTNIWLSSLWENSHWALLPGLEYLWVSLALGQASVLLRQNFWEQQQATLVSLPGEAENAWLLNSSLRKYLCNIHGCLCECFAFYGVFFYQPVLVNPGFASELPGDFLQKQSCQGPTLQRFWPN